MLNCGGNASPSLVASNQRDLRSQTLDLLRFPLAVVIVIIHTFSSGGFTIKGNSITLESMPFLSEVNNFINGFLRGQSVPIYFFISGYVFFLGVQFTKEKYLQKLKNRVKTLFIPYVIWNVIALLFLFFFRLPCFSSLLPNLHNANIDFSLSAILNTFWDSSKGVVTYGSISSVAYPQNFPLWFLKNLMIVVLCTPILYWLLKRTRYYLLLALGVFWFSLIYLDLKSFDHLTTAFFFFSFGAYMSVNKKDMLQEFGKYFKWSMFLYPLLALLFVLSVHYFPEASATIKRLNIFVGLFFAYNLSVWLLTHRVCKVSSFLSSSSFFIYVSHILVCANLMKLLMLVFNPNTEIAIFFVQLIGVVLTVLLLLLVFYLLRRFAPSLLKIIAGRK